MRKHHQTHPDVVKRLKRATGHLNAIVTMIEDERSCPEVLQQMSAVLAAIQKSRKIFLEDHLTGCIVEAAASGDSDAALEEMSATLRMIL